MTTDDGDAVDPDPARGFPAAGAPHERHADYHRQAAAHFGSTPSGPAAPAGAAGRGSGQILFDLQPWHALSAVAALCLLVALFASSMFGWILVALLSVVGAWYFKTHNVAWPPTLREVLAGQRLAAPPPSTVAGRFPGSVSPVDGVTSSGTPGASTAPAAGAGPAMIAALLALVLGIYWLWETYDLWRNVSEFASHSMPGTGGLRAILIVEALVSTATNVALIVGAVQLGGRNPRGRGWVVFGCLIILADAVATWANIYGGFRLRLSAVPSVITPRLFGSLIHSQDDVKAWVLIGTAVPLLAVVLACSAATRRWCGASSSLSPGFAAAAITVAGLVAVVVAGSGHRLESARAAVVPTPTTTTTSVVADATSLAIKNASVGDCIRRILGPTRADGGPTSVTVTPVSCASTSATDVVTAVTDHTGACGREWVQTTTFGSPIVLCLRKM
ncbi:hypothetical protein JF780_07725 [Mycobacterium intracellulare]|uniref:hypothetical protein n=1 Tax=Mycobacterium intracellulare TaxID=1767 RepID=UPI001CD9A03E|nr:hypothetical protein [Mycobacterium intracellulare]MCA2272422.1 hypothetical protein [Mycobacterium intracellulare]MCA2324840.1 hypothetical protein [Mycobacterium intracellulare]